MNLNNFKGKKMLVTTLSGVYSTYFEDIDHIELKQYRNGNHTEEFIVLSWKNGLISTANNNCNSLSATAENVARMLDGGVYENIGWYKEIMMTWEEVK